MVAKEGAAGAVVITGPDKIDSQYGNGDCLLLDFKHRFFALSDSTERFPRASRELLERLSAMFDGEGRPGTREEWLDRVNAVLSRQLYHLKATLSCVALRSAEDGRGAVVIHGGDSMVFFIDAGRGAVEFRTKPDMNFAGRAKSIPLVREVPVGDGDWRIVLCSDGFGDLARHARADLEELLLSMTGSLPVHEIPARVREMARLCGEGAAGKRHDDVSFLVLDPRRIGADCSLRVIMGGTTPYEEETYQNRVLPRARGSRWLDVEEIGSNADLVESCGIHVL
jgi:hypothetical protein